jgi:hypothetical protein
MHCLESRKHNFVCPYHAERDKNGTNNDFNRTDESPFQVTGTPFTRTTKRGADNKRREGILDCGCSADDVLLDFYWWKMTIATSISTNIEEGWRGERLEPRPRLFMKSEWEYISGLTVDDIYRKKMKSWDYEIHRCTLQIAALEKNIEKAKRESKQRQRVA